MAQAHHQPVRVAGHVRTAQLVGEQEEHQVGISILDPYGNPRRIGVIVKPPDWIVVIGQVNGGQGDARRLGWC